MSYEPGDRLSEAEVGYLRDLGYVVGYNINGGHVAKPSYAPWCSARAEHAFVRRVGEDAARAIDAVWRLGGDKAAREARRELDGT